MIMREMKTCRYDIQSKLTVKGEPGMKMKYTKITMTGMTAALILNGTAAVFADGTADTDTQQSAYVQQAEENGREGFRSIPGMDRPEDIDMSSLELPEDFVPFDEAHVPDGKNAPEKGELKPIEFDEDGNMLFGQKPEDMPPMMNGERPELPEGEMPAFGDGGRPELPEGEMPAYGDSQMPVLPADGQDPQMNGQGPRMGGQNFQAGGQRPQIYSQNDQNS